MGSQQYPGVSNCGVRGKGRGGDVSLDIVYKPQLCSLPKTLTTRLTFHPWKHTDANRWISDSSGTYDGAHLQLNGV